MCSTLTPFHCFIGYFHLIQTYEFQNRKNNHFINVVELINTVGKCQLIYCLLTVSRKFQSNLIEFMNQTFLWTNWTIMINLDFQCAPIDHILWRACLFADETVLVETSLALWLRTMKTLLKSYAMNTREKCEQRLDSTVTETLLNRLYHISALLNQSMEFSRIFVCIKISVNNSHMQSEWKTNKMQLKMKTFLCMFRPVAVELNFDITTAMCGAVECRK